MASTPGRADSVSRSVWLAVPARRVTEAQAWAGIEALALAGYRGRGGEVKARPQVEGPHRPGFVVMFAAMVAAAPAAPAELPPPPEDGRWVPAAMTEAQFRAAAHALRLVRKYRERMLADEDERRRLARMYAAMVKAGALQAAGSDRGGHA